MRRKKDTYRINRRERLKGESRLAACLLCLLFAAVLPCGTLRAQTRVIAHRGYWQCEGSAQNSLTSMQRAAGIGVYGTEFDVQMTLDKTLLIFHDDAVEGDTICYTEYATLKAHRLANGEPLPTLDDYLEAGKALPHTQLILEIKPHPTEALETEATQLVVEKVNAMEMERQVEYISFSRHICTLLAQLAPGAKIAYLEGDLSPEELHRQGINGIDYPYKVLVEKPEWITEAHALGMGVNVWTVNTPEKMAQMAALGVDFLTTDHPEEALELTK